MRVPHSTITLFRANCAGSASAVRQNNRPRANIRPRTAETTAHSAEDPDLARARDGDDAEITASIGPDHFAPFGLPASLP